MRNFKRILAVGDSHCGHRTGLTPVKYQSEIVGKQYYKIQSELWNFYSEAVRGLLPIDILAINGDVIDGKGSRSGSSELITADINKQIEMAVDCFDWIGAESTIMTYGTPYHVGQEDDYELHVAKALGADISSHQWFNVNGTVFDMKHKIGSSSVPYGRATQLSKDRLWNFLWTEFGEQPGADIYIRSHVHYFNYVGDDSYLAMTLPALQGHGSKFGARQCSGTVHFGFVWFDCYEDGSYTWSRKILRAESQRQEVKLL